MTDRKDYHRQYYLKRKQLKLVNNPPRNLVEKPLKAKPVKTFNLGKIPHYLTIASLLIFIFFNSAFLVNEQLRFYLLKGYSESYGIFISVLCEIAVVMLSFIASGWEFRKTHSRLKVLAVLFLTIACVLGTIVLGIVRDDSKAKQTEEISDLMRKELSIIEKQVEENPKLSPKLLKKETELRNFLTDNEIHSVARETFVMSIIRALAIFWNMIFASFLGTLLRRN